jgi:hypothetical protein
MLTVDVIADHVRRLHMGRARDIAAYWLEEPASRSELAQQLSSRLASLPILVATVPKGAFDDPNGVIDDLSRLIEDNSGWFTEVNRNSIIRDEKFSFVLLSKRPLGVPQISSPVTLPDWFPLWPGKLLLVRIQSITESIDISIGSSEVPISEVNSSMHALEGALGFRLLQVFRRAPALSARLRARLQASKVSGDVATLVANSQAALAKLAPGDFRPGGGINSTYIVSQLFRLWWESSHNELHALSADLAQALDIHANSNCPAQFCLASMLTRTVKPKLSETPPGVTFSRNALVSLAHSIQFTNAAHHGGDYPNFPAVLTISYAQDLARSCRSAADCLSSLT